MREIKSSISELRENMIMREISFAHQIRCMDKKGCFFIEKHIYNMKNILTFNFLF